MMPQMQGMQMMGQMQMMHMQMMQQMEMMHSMQMMSMQMMSMQMMQQGMMSSMDMMGRMMQPGSEGSAPGAAPLAPNAPATVPSTGMSAMPFADSDVAFVQLMIKAWAKEIIAAQQAEIEKMQTWRKDHTQ